MKKPLKLGFCDTFNPVPEFFTEVLSFRYDIIRDDINPDYLIFGDDNFGRKNYSFDPNKITKIFYTGENRRPNNYICHAAISFDHDFNPKMYRLPLYVLNMWHQKKMGLPNVYDVVRFPFDLENGKKKDFCGFVNSNPNCPERNTFFHRLSEYKKVASGGPLFNNVGYIVPRDDKGIQNKIKFLSNYKFTLAYENGSYPGYATEKMLEAYLAGTVPIYWGSPTVELDFNPRCFLNRHDYPSDAAFIEQIKALDQDNHLYMRYYLEPLFQDNQPNKFCDLDRFLDWFDANVYHGVN